MRLDLQPWTMKKIRFNNTRGLKLVGNFWKGNTDLGIVMAHGFTGSKEQYGKFTHIATVLNNAEFNVLSFDFSGCGESEDDIIDISREVEDLEAAVEWMKNQGMEEIGLLGLSQGGTICLEYGEAKSMVLINPLTSALPEYSEKLSQKQRKELDEKGFTFREKKGEDRNRFNFTKDLVRKKEQLDQESLLEDVKCPVLIIQGERDETVPLEHSRGAVKKLDDARLETIDDDHYFKNSLGKVSELSKEFFEEKMK